MTTLAAILSSEQQAQLLPEGLIFLGYRGSIAHDMYVPKNDPNSIDDRDLMGIFVAPLEHYLGFGRVDYWKNSEQRQRWVATALLQIEPKLNAVSGYQYLPQLRAAMALLVGKQNKNVDLKAAA